MREALSIAGVEGRYELEVVWFFLRVAQHETLSFAIRSSASAAALESKNLGTWFQGTIFVQVVLET